MITGGAEIMGATLLDIYTQIITESGGANVTRSLTSWLQNLPCGSLLSVRETAPAQKVHILTSKKREEGEICLILALSDLKTPLSQKSSLAPSSSKNTKFFFLHHPLPLCVSFFYNSIESRQFFSYFIISW